MSGGSYEYFYLNASDKLRGVARDLSSMAKQCNDPAMWGRKDVNENDLAAVGAYLEALALKVDGLAIALTRLEQVTHDIEWWQSGDQGPGQVVESFKTVTATGQKVSARGHGLLGSRGERPVLTVEAYVKWYSLHLILPSGEVEVVTFDELESYAPTAYVDHTPNPKAVEAFAEAKGYDVDELALDLIVGRWVREVER